MAESETHPFTCPFCETEFQLPVDAWYFTCPGCGHRLDITSQFAYLRGVDAFTEGQALMEEISPRRRRIPNNHQDTRAMELFQEAYSSIQVALLAELAEAQRMLAVEMMASLSGEFMKRNMISPMEMNYWHMLMVELTAQVEYETLKEKLAAATPGDPLSRVAQLRWRSRQKKLLDSLVEIEQKILTIEKQIEFVDIPKARNKRWKP